MHGWAVRPSYAVVVDPTTRQVTHFALQDKSLGDPTNRLVRVEHVVEATEGSKPSSIYRRPRPTR